MTKEKILEKVNQALKDVYGEYSKQGMISVYLHGSILNDDFNIEASDVDAIAIVKENISPELEEKINKLFLKEYPEIHHFTVRFLYESELNGGEVRGFIAKYIHPASLLFDLPNWKLIVGEEIDKGKYALGKLGKDDLIYLRLEKIKWKIETLNESKDNHIYLLKSVARLCYLIYGADKSFSYSNLKAQTTEDTKEVVDFLMEVRDNNWNREKFDEKFHILEDFIDEMSGKNGC